MTARARLDANRTAQPLTRIVHHPPRNACLGPHMPLMNPEYEDESGKRTALTEPAEKAPAPLPVGAKYGVERCLEWLRDHAVSIEAEIDDECDGADADAFCEQAETIRKAAREMAAAFGVELKR